jgi:copper chaperone CopZ
MKHTFALAFAFVAPCLLVSCASTPGANRANMVSFPVEGMACANCAADVAHHLHEVPGVKSAKVDFDKKLALVDLDPDRPASMGALRAAVEQWRVEHFGQQEDPDCLNPDERKRLQGK